MRNTLTIMVSLLCVSNPLMAVMFQGLGDLPGETVDSGAYKISGNGVVVVGSSFSAREAFYWTATTGMVGLGFMSGGNLSMARDVSADGRIIVGNAQNASRYDQAFRWEDTNGNGVSDPGEMTSLSGLGYYDSRAYGISGDGKVIIGHGYYSVGGGIEAWRWEDGVKTIITINGGADDVSYDGSVVVGSHAAPDVSRAYRWENGELINLGILPGWANSYSLAVSEDGAVVAGYCQTDGVGHEAFLWDSVHGMQSLGDLPNGPVRSGARDISADKSVVVGWGTGNDGDEAVMWDAAGIHRICDVLHEYGLDLGGWRLIDAGSVSDDGRVIVGSGYNPDGNYEAWIAVIPEPTTLALLTFGGLALFRRRK